jgi:TRAP transporter 4TM/12TM fusion protein
LAIIAGGLATTTYIQIFYDELLLKWTHTPLEIVLGFILIIVVIEGTRRAFGVVFPVITSIFLLYAFLGHYLPEPLHIMKLPVEQAISKLVLGLSTGIFGGVLSISADYIFLFIMFGAILGVSGATNFFMETGRLMGQKLKSGPALTAVVTSALMGTVTGSVVSNIATTGAFTIPLMKKVGYRAEQAGGIETASSIGGLMMPPVMGVAAFLMVGFTDVPYLTIMTAALIPAILYFSSVGFYVHLYALKFKLTPIAEEVDIQRLLLTAPIFVGPLVVLIALLVLKHTAFYSIFWAIIAVFISSIIIGQLRKDIRPSFKQWIEAISRGAITGCKIAITCAALGLIVAVFESWGVGIKIPMALMVMSRGILPLALVLTAFIAVIISTGLPAVPTYVIVVITAAPILLKMGLPLLPVHFFVFYIGCMSYAIPPIALGALVASNLAGAGFWRTAIEAIKVGIGGFVVPFLFIMSPELMLQSDDTLLILASVIAAALILLVIQISICGYYLTSISFLERYILFLIVLALLVAFLITGIYLWLAVGVGLFILLTLWQQRKKSSFIYTEQGL